MNKPSIFSRVKAFLVWVRPVPAFTYFIWTVVKFLYGYMWLVLDVFPIETVFIGAGVALVIFLLPTPGYYETPVVVRRIILIVVGAMFLLALRRAAPLFNSDSPIWSF